MWRRLFLLDGGGRHLRTGIGGAALASQANLDKGITTIFKGSTDLVYYGTVPVSPLIYQDDVLSLAETVIAARASLQKVNSVMKQKRLTLNKDKTAYILFGQQEKQDQIREALKLEPLICGSFEVQEKQFDKYLGEIFHSDGLSRSALETIRARTGKIKAVSFEIRAIIEDYRSEVVG